MSVNKIILIGRVGATPEVTEIKEGVKVAKFSLATSESYTNKAGEKVENTEWHNLVVWRGLAGVVEKYVKKGSKLYIEGKLTHRQYEKDGQTKYFTEIVVNQMEMLDSKGSNTEQKEKPVSNTQNESFEDNDNLPF